MKNWVIAFKEEMEKRAFLGSTVKSTVLGPGLLGALTAYDVSQTNKEMQQKSKLTPLRQESQYNIGNPNQYQFEGGKHTNLKSVRYPHALS